MGRVAFQPTHAGFAAELLDDVRAEFLRVTSTLDEYIALARHLKGSDSAAIITCAPSNREALVAAAAYAQWISDHIRQEAARWGRADRTAAAGYVANDIDQQVLLAIREGEESGGTVVAPSPTPPSEPGALEQVEQLPHSDLARLMHARGICAQAWWAAGKSETEGMRAVCGHINTLRRWLQQVRRSPAECEEITVGSYDEASALAMHMLNSLRVESDEAWAATLLAGDALGALLFAGSPCGNGLGMAWVRSVAVTLCDPKYDVNQAIRLSVDGS